MICACQRESSWNCCLHLATMPSTEGKNNEGTKKSQYALQIAALINAKNMKVNRTAKDVINKIQYLEKSFKNAWEYANSVTRAGVREDDPETSEAKLEEKCYYYMDLLPIMGDQSGNNPGVNSNLLDHSSKDEEELEDLQEPSENDDQVEKAPKARSGTTSQPATNFCHCCCCQKTPIIFAGINPRGQ